MKETIQFLELGTKLLVSANVAIPIVFATISAVAGIFKAITGRGPSLTEIAALIEAQVGQNDVTIRAEVARLQAIVHSQG